MAPESPSADGGSAAAREVAKAGPDGLEPTLRQWEDDELNNLLIAILRVTSDRRREAAATEDALRLLAFRKSRRTLLKEPT